MHVSSVAKDIAHTWLLEVWNLAAHLWLVPGSWRPSQEAFIFWGASMSKLPNLVFSMIVGCLFWRSFEHGVSSLAWRRWLSYIVKCHLGTVVRVGKRYYIRHILELIHASWNDRMEESVYITCAFYIADLVYEHQVAPWTALVPIT